MDSSAYNHTYNVPVTFDDILKIIQSLTIEDKLRVEKELEKETLLHRAKKLDRKIRKNSVSMDDIVSEIAEYRAGNNE
mgnify:CR=1 FL=1